ncbi:BREX-1 system adenine-specific DNA-methyltransferase PglX [Trujillonella humicola]|uniref:BREX-1 system adenine-specific DNA-methyltransferase PglX n=1 Tax=Trujillonella humicola TaxID=3383699 RepID=UPI0039066D76
METAPLKAFATWARIALIREVTARIAVVLGPASTERVEQPRTVESLQRAVNTAGGGDKGRTVVADRVAYTWFNRIIALRFMDANGYTGLGVVSPGSGGGGQPEILAEAKRGSFDPEVVRPRTRDTVTGLLDGTRRAVDPQGEAYALLLADHCRHWNRAMPFMFEREGDFTELLIPANLLADDSVLNRAVNVLTETVCQDVEVIGWLYQFYISERKDEVFAGFKKNNKAGAAEIAAATQLFTPHWIVRYLVENSLGRLWMLNRPTSNLVHQMDYYMSPVDEGTEFVKVNSPEELRIIDPACGSGHMLTYAFDLLYAIYQEEGYAPSEIPALILSNNLYGLEIDPRAGALAAFALTMKARAVQRTFFNKKIEPQVCVLEPISFTPDELDALARSDGGRDAQAALWNRFEHAEVLGSLIQSPEAPHELLSLLPEADSLPGDTLFASDLRDRASRLIRQATLLASKYHVVVANPPYMGNKNMGDVLSAFAKRAYPDAKSDLFAMFMERCLALSDRSGLVGMITMQSWMFLSAFKKLRLSLLDRVSLQVMAHLGTNAFDSVGGEVVSTTAFISANTLSESAGQYVDLREGRSGKDKAAALRSAIETDSAYRVTASQLRSIDGAPIAYWLSQSFRQAFGSFPPLGEKLKAAVGLNTGNNDRFLRLWHEVSHDRIGFGIETLDDARHSGYKWFPYNKGGGHRKWYGNNVYVINWEDDGRELKELATLRNQGRHWSRYIQNLDAMLKECITWSDITTRTFAARYSPPGFFFDVKGSSGIPAEHADMADILSLLCSSLMPQFMKALNPTSTFQVGDLARVPLATGNEAISDLGSFLPIMIAREDWDRFERSWDFQGSPLLTQGPRHGSIEGLLDAVRARWDSKTELLRRWEEDNSRNFARRYSVPLPPGPSAPEDVTLTSNPNYRFPGRQDPVELQSLQLAEDMRDLISYAVGCMFGRYSLDTPGLILARQGGSLNEYLDKVPDPSFAPDQDNVIPIVDGDWFEDDIVARFRRFLRVAFGEELFEDNLLFVMQSIGVKDLRDYFLRDFYKDHVQRYKKRPIYWLFSSPKGAFNALIYVHRYTPSTVSTVLNEYLREYKAKLEASLQHLERLAAGGGTSRQQAGALREADRLRKVLLELEEYEHDVLYPLASRQISIDLDDGVKVNYAKFGAALKKIPGLESSE